MRNEAQKLDLLTKLKEMKENVILRKSEIKQICVCDHVLKLFPALNDSMTRKFLSLIYCIVLVIIVISLN